MFGSAASVSGRRRRGEDIREAIVVGGMRGPVPLARFEPCGPPASALGTPLPETPGGSPSGRGKALPAAPAPSPSEPVSAGLVSSTGPAGVSADAAEGGDEGRARDGRAETGGVDGGEKKEEKEEEEAAVGDAAGEIRQSLKLDTPNPYEDFDAAHDRDFFTAKTVELDCKTPGSVFNFCRPRTGTVYESARGNPAGFFNDDDDAVQDPPRGEAVGCSVIPMEEGKGGCTIS
ncbi:unnamed protein product [Scytosiphon promiscuus]